MAFEHVPVMSREVVELLTPVPAGVLIDATVGGGGHARVVLEARPDLELLGIDRDAAAVAASRERLAGFGGRVRIARGGFEDIGEIATTNGIDEGTVVGIVFDLGVSSPQLDRPERGFSYWSEAPLDMRMDSAQELTAADVVNNYSEQQLADLIARNGEERFAGRIARRIVAKRPLRTTADLVDAVKEAIPAPARRRGGHPARRTFQAIRMEVNQEVPNLAAGLEESVHLLAPGGRALVLAYHSLEDRMVKERFASLAGRAPTGPARPLPVPDVAEPGFRLLTRRPLRPSPEEVTANPRAASARLRGLERVPTDRAAR
ncbi:MAG: 16S rRNA (cytosine(1402)-N(4))-methyltransferase RsmH [Actinobacteria bacterium]|nr:16S rRNA (cytosine(1402)-N(4))-methyltransferase RsmH [Actinomycetota bacterium]